MSDFSERKIEERLAEPDILDTLRWLAGDRGWQGWVYETARRAADEIERLRAERDRWRNIADEFAEMSAFLPAPDGLADAVAAAVPDPAARSEYDRLLGPFYSSAGVMRVLRIPTKQALADRRKRGTLLAARTSDGVWVYPAFQFDQESHSVRRSLVPVLAQLKAAPRWGAALWLVTEHDDLGHRSPLAAATAGSKDRELVCRLAAQYARAAAA